MRKRRNRTKNNSILFIKTNTSGRNGVIRGNKFNKIVKEFIINLHLDAHRFQVFFEKKNEFHFTIEMPDWYVLEKSTNKITIGMNQLDLREVSNPNLM